MIDTEDIGEVAARCLTEGGHECKTDDSTGPVALSHVEAATVLAKVLGRAIACVDVPQAAAAKVMRSHGHPPWLVEGLGILFGAYASGVASAVSPAVERIVGRSPRSFESFLGAHRAAFA